RGGRVKAIRSPENGRIAMRDGIQPAEKTRRKQAAKAISLFLQPMTAAAILYAIVAWNVSGGWEAAGYFLIGVSFIAVGPAVLILLLKHARMISDLDLSDRRERFKPYLMFVGLNTLSLVIYVLEGAPKPLLGVTASYVTVTLAGGIISNYWKISMHLAGIAGPVTALTMVVHPLLAVFYLLCVPVGWARLFLNKHTVPQVIWGSLFSAALTMTVISLIL
ncbi:MAG TPA: hypothetical protein VLH40_05670, partial [Atribacteraceae bacterium]|nr:hypothetical protein [Atribacteraceae bacterium]